MHGFLCEIRKVNRFFRFGYALNLSFDAVDFGAEIVADKQAIEKAMASEETAIESSDSVMP